MHAIVPDRDAAPAAGGGLLEALNRAQWPQGCHVVLDGCIGKVSVSVIGKQCSIQLALRQTFK